MNPSLAPASLRDWIDLPRERLREAIAAASLDDPASLLRSIRDEAGRFFQSDVATSRAIASRAIEIAGILGDPLSSGWAHRSMAEAWLFSGRMKEAEASYETAARFWRAAGARSLLGQLLVGRIHVLAMLGRYADAEATAEEARQHLTAEGDDTYLAKLAMNFGNIQFHRDHYGPALLEYERAGQAFHRLGLRDETVIGLDVNRGVALSQLDRDVEALDLFSRLEQECAARGYDLLLAQVRMNAAFVHANRGDYDLALRDLARAAPYFEETGHLSFLASCLLTRAEIYNKLNLAAEALDLSEQAARHFLGLGLRYFAALALSQGALASLVRREPARAIERGREARRLFLLEKNRPRAAFMELLWAEGLAQAGRRKASLVRAGAALSTF
ncbi:MAG: hypothetical protein QUU85_09780, partial [Candidatus Eisenbacteria bacterium]|nr:hypothetical protein [Candidatus Eisenbacteria bacterium]